ncbi:hypothetical protein JF66_03580 [Cryobacterium sp. MLB-32]|uniref:DsbA family protein n=1 Tax=Cryobacterium sp. MLB-32 TaxID=1529318 RepID=UPI0004E7062D|nr:hypothetical protein [Cryobacterium sp. MLB-32]KFF60571.1 hypothetical protein JF66_03580 [Cryobacterium sp. MLB-32]
MFCIAAFIVLVVMAIFSARYRRYVGKAWTCTWRRVTFRPCDTTFKQDVKDHLLAPIAARRPGLVRPASITLEVLAVLVILTTVWSGYTVVKSAANLYVYGTCNKQDSASCSLGAEACSVTDETPDFMSSLGAFDVIGAFGNEFSSLGETFAAIPARFRTWTAEEYLPANASYLTENAANPIAVEVIDPGCPTCKALLQNIEDSGFAQTHNLTYIAYPIEGADGYKFPNSLLVTQYLEALRLHPLAGADTPVDWQVIERLFTEKTDTGLPWQSALKSMDTAEATATLAGWLEEFGLSADQIDVVVAEAGSDAVADIVAANKTLVEDKIATVKIPTIIFDGRRHDGLVSVDGLR